MELDQIDRKIVARLMADATIPVARLAAEVGLSQTPCWKRVQKLTAGGVIRARVALVDPEQLGLDLTVFAVLEAPEASEDWHRRFAEVVADIPEIMEVHRLAARIDYMLRVVVRDMAGFDRVSRRLTEALPVRALRTQFVSERVKESRVLPM